MRKACVSLFSIVLALGVTFPANGGQVKIYRDGWGVPHIYGDSETDVMYGFGYAQAEDRLEALLINYRKATGRMSEVFGPDHLESDLRQRIWGHARLARNRYGELSPDIRALIEGFVSGIAAWMQTHPESVPVWASAPAPHHVVALGRYMAWQELTRQADLDYSGDNAEGPHTANQWVIGPGRSAEDAVILCIDPHRLWDDTTRDYEAHLHGGVLHAFGFAHPGLPVFAVGHNDRLGWSAAPGGPDCADVYEIELETETASRYRYDRGWKPIVTDTVNIAVKRGGRVETRSIRTQSAHHGPIYHRHGTRAYAYRLAASRAVNQIEQLYRQITATDIKAFFSALALAQTGPQRVIYGDGRGNIAYIRAGATPLRSEIYTWDRPLPGNTAATAWKGMHPQEDLVQAYNPPQGWMQDCGASPDLIMPYSFLTPDRYAAYIFNTPPGAQTPQSHRAGQILSALSRMTRQEAFDLALDTYVTGSDAWKHALMEAFVSDGHRFRNTDPDLDRAVDLLIRWNGRADSHEAGMALYARWQKACRRPGRTVNARHILSRQKLGGETCRGLLDALAEAAAEMKAAHGELTVPWAEVHRLRRGDNSWGVSGSAGQGLETLRTVVAEREGAIGYGISGQSCVTVVLFRAQDQVESFSAVPYGQSDDPASPHFRDQAEALFSKGRLKPNGFQRAGVGPSAVLKLQHTLTTQSLP